jgi:group I intron endonuclease
MVIYTIYKVTNNINGKRYIGYSADWKSRRRIHKYIADKNKKSYPFYNAIRKYGFDNFSWEVIYQSKDKMHTLEEMETFFIHEYNTLAPNGYNMKTGGEGGNLSSESRKKISDSRIGIKFSDEHINNLRLSHLNKKHTEEEKQKISNALKGKNKGKILGPLSAETKAKMSASLKGKKYEYVKKLRCSCVVCHKEISNNHVGIHYKTHKNLLT